MTQEQLISMLGKRFRHEADINILNPLKIVEISQWDVIVVNNDNKREEFMLNDFQTNYIEIK